MKCYIHNDRVAVASCVSCGNLICEECRVIIDGKNYCKNCISKKWSNKTWFTDNGQPFTPSTSRFNLNISTISKLLLYVAIIFSAVEIMDRVFVISGNILSSIFYLRFGIKSLIVLIYNLMMVGVFALLLVVNLSKLVRIKFVNSNNIGTLTAIAVALLILASLMFSLFNIHVGFLQMIIINLTEFDIFIPIVATLINIFGIYKHKLNLDIN